MIVSVGLRRVAIVARGAGAFAWGVPEVRNRQSRKPKSHQRIMRTSL